MNQQTIELSRRETAEKLLQTEIDKLPPYEREMADRFINGHRVARNVMSEFDERLTFGQRVADRIASFGGSWTFIFLFLGLLMVWMMFNTFVLAVRAFDPYPYILLNLILSCIAALQAPVIMMSQNRQEEKDRERAKKDYMINLKSELEIRLLHEKIDHLIINQQEKLMEIQQVQIDMMNDILNRIERKKVS